jgi:hypothetical protein
MCITLARSTVSHASGWGGVHNLRCFPIIAYSTLNCRANECLFCSFLTSHPPFFSFVSKSISFASLGNLFKFAINNFNIFAVIPVQCGTMYCMSWYAMQRKMVNMASVVVHNHNHNHNTTQTKTTWRRRRASASADAAARSRRCIGVTLTFAGHAHAHGRRQLLLLCYCLLWMWIVTITVMVVEALQLIFLVN